MKFRKKPVVIEAMQWTGDNLDEMQAFAYDDQVGCVFGRVDPESPRPRPREPDTDDPEITAEVFDFLHSTWVGVKDNQWIIKGVQGEFYPCDPDVFEATYEPAEEKS